MTRDLRAIGSFVAVYSSLLLSCSGAADKGRELFPGFADAHTAALWLFDEPLTPDPDCPAKVSPWDYTRTLTDASENMYDLKRLELNLAANYATVPKISGIFVGGIDNEEGRRLNLFLYTFTPRRLISALEGNSWTWETWIRLLSRGQTNATLFDMGFGFEPEFSITLWPLEKCFLKGRGGRRCRNRFLRTRPPRKRRRGLTVAAGRSRN